MYDGLVAARTSTAYAKNFLLYRALRTRARNFTMRELFPIPESPVIAKTRVVPCFSRTRSKRRMIFFNSASRPMKNSGRAGL